MADPPFIARLRFSESNADVRESQRHNTRELYALHDELISADAGWTGWNGGGRSSTTRSPGITC